MRFPCCRFVGAAVIALMALTSVAPFQLTHAHTTLAKENESRAHGHDHSHSHSHTHPHHHHGNEGFDGQTLSASDVHTHVYFLGMEIVVNGVPGGDENQQERQPNELTRSFLGKTVRQDASASLSLRLLFDLDQLPLAWSVSAPLVTCDGRSAIETGQIAAPLCDAARHERTGVLLV